MNYLLALSLIAVGLLNPASAGMAQTADPIARDIASTGGLLCDGKVSCQTQGEDPVFDHNGDGRLDILLAGHGGAPWALMHYNGNNTHFTQTFDFPKTDRHGCVAVDLASLSAGLPDGRLDVYCVTGNHLFLQTPTHTFVDEGGAWGVADIHGRGRVPLVLDLNRDGRPDLAVVNQAPSVVRSPNRLFRNMGGRFVEVTGGIAPAAT